MAAVALAFMWATSAEACEPTSAYQAIVAPASGILSIDVPVVIHIMERPSPSPSCETRDRWSSAKVRLLFGPANSNRAVASIWGETNIRFVVKKVLVQSYTPPADLTSSGQVTTPASGPTGTAEWEVAFSQLVQEFHHNGHVNVYLWKTLANDIAGFGRSPRSGRGKATVWLGGKCVDSTQMTFENCARVTAHELGHSLGLYHSGPGRCSAVPSEFQPICMTTTATCGEADNSERLMASGEDGRMLCPAEVTAAKEMVPSLR